MKIGDWFKDCDKIQKSVRRDPHPHVPFCDAPLFIGDKFERNCMITIWVCILLITITLVWFQ